MCAASRSTLALALLSAALLWLALPPCDLWPLAWIAPVGWLTLIRMERMPGRRPYRALYLAGFAFWMAAFHWLRLPHWVTSFGWVALSLYLGCYLPAFIGLSRVAVHRWRVPLVIAAPVVWAGLELLRGHLLTGITMASLGHTQWHWVQLIQISDLGGAYGVGFLMMFVAACLAQTLPLAGRKFLWWPLPLAAAAFAAALLYGAWRELPTPPAEARVALIQGSIDSELKASRELPQKIFEHYVGLSRDALAASGPLDLLVWPEAMFRYPIVIYDSQPAKPPGVQLADDEFLRRLTAWADSNRQGLVDVVHALGKPMIVGVDTIEFGRDRQRFFNSAALVAGDGTLLARYDKMHPVPFGEYQPFVEYLPWLRRLTPLPESLSSGKTAAVFPLGKLKYCPSICYENVIPHLIRQHINDLAAKGQEPDVLVNLTNDGWFWGSSELDMHLACAIFRAVECRKPMLVAANTGLSAWIDGNGRAVKLGPRHQPGVVVAEVGRDPRSSWYLRFGDWPWGFCLLFCGLLAADSVRLRGRPLAHANAVETAALAEPSLPARDQETPPLIEP